MGDGDAYLSYAEARNSVTSSTTLLSDAELDEALDQIDGEIHLHAGLESKTTNTVYIQIFKRMETEELKKVLKGLRLGKEMNPATNELPEYRLSDYHISLCHLIREETDVPAYTRRFVDTYSLGDTLD